jgi:hypothetical protein
VRRLLVLLVVLFVAACDDDAATPDAAPPADAARPDADRGACGTIDRFGVCDGDTLRYCDEPTLTLVTQDCTASYQTCGFVSPSVGQDCTNACARAEIDAAGRCSEGGILHCELAGGAYAVVTTPCPAGTTCKPSVLETHAPECVPDGCAGVGPVGRCAGDVLTTCAGGTPATVDCAASGGVCAYAGDEVGYACAPGGQAGAFALTGTIRYQDRAPLPDGALAALAPAPARGVTVALVDDADGSVLAAGLTSDDGSYTLRYDAAPGASVHLLAAATSALPARSLRVLRPDGLVHGVAGASFAAAITGAQDLLAADADGVAPAFNVFEQLRRAVDRVRAVYAIDAPTPLYAVYARAYEPQTTQYHASLHSIDVLGSFADDDGFDDTVILHETGHYVADTVGHLVQGVGGHVFGEPADPLLAYSEGFATYWALSVNDDPHYADSNAAGGFGVDADSGLTLAPMPAGDQTQRIPEDLVFQVMWDLADGARGDDDAYAGDGHATTLHVLTDYLATPALVSRGAPGIDLVEWLDGFYVGTARDACVDGRAVVTGDHQFPYDHAGPGGVCQ